MITAEAMKPFGLALKDFYAGDNTAEVKVSRDDGLVSSLSISAFFRGAVDFQIDKIALDNCRGSILDIGAGAGIHSLYLQQQGFDVTALDVCPEAYDVMRNRGINNIICSNITDLKGKTYDTLLMMGRSIAMVETLAGLATYLEDVHRLVNPGGQILLNSMDVSMTSNPRDIAYQQANREAGRYMGEIRVEMEYKGIRRSGIRMLHIDALMLEAHAAATGWASRVLLQEKDGNYLAVLEKAV